VTLQPGLSGKMRKRKDQAHSPTAGIERGQLAVVVRAPLTEEAPLVPYRNQWPDSCLAPERERGRFLFFSTNFELLGVQHD
jgi:hypothetical protein